MIPAHIKTNKMKNLLSVFKNLFSRHQIVESIQLDTGVVCIHSLDTWRGVITIKTI